MTAHSPGDSVESNRHPLDGLLAADFPTPEMGPFDAGRWYIAHDLALIPCCRASNPTGKCSASTARDTHRLCPKPGKRPTARWKGRLLTTPDEVHRWWAHASPHGPNVALLTGPCRVLALDVDSEEGAQMIALAEATLGSLPNTLVNLTGRGRHLLYKFPSGASIEECESLVASGASLRFDADTRTFFCEAIEDATTGERRSTGLDIRAGSPSAPGGYILVAPSVHRSGAKYSWDGGPIAELPPAWWRALPRRNTNGGDGPRGGTLLSRLSTGATAPEGGTAVLRGTDTGQAAAPSLAQFPPAGGVRAPLARREASTAVRAQAILASIRPQIVADVRNAQSGTRNDTLYRRALRAFRLCLAAELSFEDTRAALDAAAAAAGLDVEERSCTLDSATKFATQQGPAVLRERPKPAGPVSAAPPAREPDADTLRTESAAAAATDVDDEPADDEERSFASRSGLPVIMCGTELSRIGDEAVRALANHPDVYQRTGMGLARIMIAPQLPEDVPDRVVQREPPAFAPMIAALSQHTIAEWLSICAEFRVHDRRARKGDGTRIIAPPPSIVAAVRARGNYPAEQIRVLFGIIEAPSLRPDGTVITRPGYDPATGLYLHWNGAPITVPETPTREDARAAFERLAELFQDFQFAGDAGAQRIARAATVAAILSPLARDAVNGPVPAFVWEADGPDAGKTLAAQTCGLIVCGRLPAVRAYTDDDSEMGKRLTAIALAGVSLVLVDNVRAHIEGGSLELVLTAQNTIAARLLGTNTDKELPWRAVMYLTANAASYSRDVSRRLLHISLRSSGSFQHGASFRPTRTFRFPELLDHVRAHRPDLLRDALTILRAHAAAGRPPSGAVLPTFEAWSRVVSHAIAWCAAADPVRARPPEGADRDTSSARALVCAWYLALREEPTTLAALKDRLVASPNQSVSPGSLIELRSALAEFAGLPDLVRASAGALGKRLGAQVVNREFPAPWGGQVVLRGVQTRTGVTQYTAEATAFQDAPVHPEPRTPPPSITSEVGHPNPPRPDAEDAGDRRGSPELQEQKLQSEIVGSPEGLSGIEGSDE